MPRPSLPTRTLPARPHLDQLKRQARELLDAFADGDDTTAAEVRVHYHDAHASTFALHDAQLVLARAYGFESWPKLKAFVDGVTIARLRDAIVADNLAEVRAMLRTRPELGHASLDNLQLLHHAVFNRSPDMVRLLMRHGAPARHGVYPHRDATTPLTIARERGYDDIVAVIDEEEQRQREAKSGIAGAPDPAALSTAMMRRDDAHVLAMIDANPALLSTCHPEMAWTPLHIAAHTLNAALVARLLELGADATVRDARDRLPLDRAAYASTATRVGRLEAIAKHLRAHGSPMTATAAAALGDLAWLRASHAAGTLINPIEDGGGLLRIAVSHQRGDALELLLACGLDANERIRFGDGDAHVFSWGMPLNGAAGTGSYAIAEMLLDHGADPNACVYASGDPTFSALGERDWKMVALLERYGGCATATAAGLFRQTALAAKMLAGEAPYRLERDGTLAEELLWGAACGGDPEIVRQALAGVEWPREDPRWFDLLEQPLRLWAHGSGSADWDRTTYLTCFRLLLTRCDPNLRGRPTDRQQFGLTILHSIAGSREHLTPADRESFAAAALDAGADLGMRDHLLRSTPLGWAARWGRVELVTLFLQRGADPREADAPRWAAPIVWAETHGHREIVGILHAAGA